MERLSRKPFQGVTNIIRFNWHYYIIAFILIGSLFFVRKYFPNPFNNIVSIIAILTILSVVISLSISWYIYDYSGLYSLEWLSVLKIRPKQILVNINAGFDETSSILNYKYPDSKLLVFDFYDPEKHTEISIERARKAYTIFPGTKVIGTNNIPLKTDSVDYIFLILSAHEIRNHEERIDFFKRLANTLNRNGRIIVVEHQRDIYNFIAYNFGFLHFFSRKIWERTFNNAHLHEISKTKITPFIKAFILKK
ncbi:MAG TPA: methyltransferase [Hanamia sp.]|nr:methyltransferase [Hanamia sp.]